MKQSAGIALYRRRGGRLEVLLVHPGGPFWARKDHGAWSIPKGEVDPDEELFDAAIRELREETGLEAPGTAVPLRPCRQRGGKIVHAWAVEGDADPSLLRSNSFTLEWPQKSGRHQVFPEVDRADWFSLDDARKRILKGQVGFLDRLMAHFQ